MQAHYVLSKDKSVPDLIFVDFR